MSAQLAFRALTACLRAGLAVCAALLVSACTSSAPVPEVAASPSHHEVEITARVPAETGPVYLTGDAEALGPWAPDALLMAGDGEVRTATLAVPAGDTLAFKFTLGGWDREAIGPDGLVRANMRMDPAQSRTAEFTVYGFKPDPLTLLEDWRGGGVLGELITWPDTASAHLAHDRHVSIWLPPGYRDSDARYRVVYMSDGQNLFDPRIANTGVDWGVDEALVRLADAGAIAPAIVVSSWSTASRREEYSPWHDAPNYARFLIEELMPRVNAEFRTLTGPANTAHVGSSMGGLVSFYLVTRHPDVFGACGCISTHVSLSPQMWAAWGGALDADQDASDPTPFMARELTAARTAPDGVRFWFDYGGKGLDAAYGPVHADLRAWLEDQGKVDGTDFVIREYVDADHTEADWRARLDDVFAFVLAP